VTYSSKFHRRTERHSFNTSVSVQINEPMPLLLKHTLTITTMLPKDSIETRFGGIGLPTTIKQSDKSITNLSNTIAVKKYRTDTINSDNFSVIKFPVTLLGDGSVHQTFDLSHGVNPSVMYIVWHGLGAKSMPCGHLSDCHRITDNAHVDLFNIQTTQLIVYTFGDNITGIL